MGAERLKELRRQRALLIEHLDWLNAEIDREAVLDFPSSTPKESRLAEAIPTSRPVAATLAPEEEDDIEQAGSTRAAADVYVELGADVKGVASEAKRGCLLVGGLGFASLAGLFAYVVWWY